MFKCTGLHQKFPKSIIFKSLMHLSISIYLLAAEVSTQHTSILTLIIFVCPSIIISWTIVQYSLVLHLVDERIANVNKSLLKIGKIPVDLEMPSVFIRKTPVDDSGQITTIRRVDVELCNFCYKIRDFYALPTLMTVTFFGSSLVYSSYFLAMPLVTRSNHHLHLTVTKITRTVKKTANIIHLLLDNCALPSESLAELKGFSRQVLMKNFHLSVYDMFPLDNSLLGSIVSTITTYLVIFVQFQLASSELKLKKQ
nr:PREDICTED: uncharacterized protein LOC105264214 [Fopius arisanus]